MKQGQTFNVSRVEGVIGIPLAMIKDRRLSFATEVLYGLLVKHSGSAGYCAVAQRKLAEEMGVSIILVRKAVAQLKRMKYIYGGTRGDTITQVGIIFYGEMNLN